MLLVDMGRVTHRAVADGNWSDAATWANGLRPIAGARVHVPAGRKISLDSVAVPHLKAVYVDGALVVSAEASTSLTVDTMLISESGRFEAGTAEAPVPDGVEVIVSILPYYDANEPEDARQHSAMFLSLGEVSVHGQKKTALAPLAVPPASGGRLLTLASPPENWQEGDLLFVGGNRLTREEGELLRIVSLAGAEVTIEAAERASGDWQGFTQDYETDRDLQSFAVNISRNVAFSSSPPDGTAGTSQGALLFLDTGVGNAALANVGLYGLGMQEGQIDGLGSAKTRPAVTFKGGAPGAATVDGLALVDAPSSTLAIDGSRVIVSNSVALDDDGGAWLTETGAPSRLLWRGARTRSSTLGALR